jgi:hypothetical protein
VLETAKFGDFEVPVRNQALEMLSRYGLRAEDVMEVRLARWGHAMLVARPGLLVEGTLAGVTQSIPGLFFAHADVYGAPAVENAMNAAFAAAGKVQAALGS